MNPLATWSEEAGGKSIGAIVGLITGSFITWMIGRWRRYREKGRVFRGDARDTIVIQQHIVDSDEWPTANGPMRVPTTLRIRSIGQAQLDRVVPNGHLAAVFLRRAWKVTTHDTLISMVGAEGSYLLETLTNFVCDRVANSPFEHDLYVMAPCCEPAELAEHQPITVILIPERDLKLFESWPLSRDVQVEHGSDGSRILTLMDMAQRYKRQHESIIEARQSGHRTRYMESMYLLDLPLDPRTAPVPTKPVPWGRYEDILQKMNLE